MSKTNDSAPTMVPPEIAPHDEPKSKCRRQRWFVVVLILFCGFSAVFAGLFGFYYIMSDNSGSLASARPDICSTTDCITTAASMVKWMNSTADPCQDFSQFACGGFYQNVKLSAVIPTTGAYYILRDVNNGVLKDIVTENITSGDARYVKNMKTYYRSCMDVGQIEKIGVAPYLNDTNFVYDWPTLNPAWNSSGFNLDVAVARYSSVFIFPLLRYSVYFNSADHAQPQVMIIPPNLGLSYEYFLLPSMAKYVKAYQTYLAEVAVALGSNADVATKDAQDVVVLKTALARMILSGLSASDGAASVNISLSQLRTLFPFVDIPGALKAAWRTADMVISEDDVVFSSYMGYLENLNKRINTFSNRTVQNLFGFTYAVSRVSDMSRRLREIEASYNKVRYPQMEESSRWEDCLNSVMISFQAGMNRQFIARTVTEETKTYVEEMVVNLKDAFRQMLEENTWMSSVTKEHALRKLDAMESVVGYPDNYADDAYFEELYRNHTMLDGNFYANAALLTKNIYIQSLRFLHQGADARQVSSLFEVNTNYYVDYNEIEIYAGMLNAPFISHTVPSYLNYGALGKMIGHEITHGFDTEGRKYDADGWPTNWWDDHDLNKFLNRTKCFVEQYSSFRIEEANMTLDGQKTLDENIADNGGLKQSYRAYKELVKRTGQQPILPGMDLTPEQLFFLSSAQMWCAKQTLPMLIYMLGDDTHSLKKFRIIGTVQNSEDFAQAYKCPRGSPMNPEKKCSVW